MHGKRRSPEVRSHRFDFFRRKCVDEVLVARRFFFLFLIICYLYGCTFG